MSDPGQPAPKTRPRPPEFLERSSYRLRRLMDAARLLPVFGLILLLLPLMRDHSATCRWACAARCPHRLMPPPRTRTRADVVQPARADLPCLCGAAVRGGLGGRAGRAGRAGKLAALVGHLHAVAVGLLHGLDLLRGSGLCRALGARVHDHLSWPHAGFRGLVGHAAQTRADRARASSDVHRRPDFRALWQVEPAWRDRHASMHRGRHALYRAATSVHRHILHGLCRRGWHGPSLAPAIWTPTSSTTGS